MNQGVAEGCKEAACAYMEARERERPEWRLPHQPSTDCCFVFVFFEKGCVLTSMFGGWVPFRPRLQRCLESTTPGPSTWSAFAVVWRRRGTCCPRGHCPNGRSWVASGTAVLRNCSYQLFQGIICGPCDISHSNSGSNSGTRTFEHGCCSQGQVLQRQNLRRPTSGKPGYQVAHGPVPSRMQEIGCEGTVIDLIVEVSWPLDSQTVRPKRAGCILDGSNIYFFRGPSQGVFVWKWQGPHRGFPGFSEGSKFKMVGLYLSSIGM